MAPSKFETTDHPYGESVGQLINEFAKLPGIGRKSAERLAHHVLATPADEVMGLAEAIRQVKESIRFCAICYNLTEVELCAICRDPRRSRHVVCVVEQPRDIVSLEAAGVYEGVYHVLGGALAPLSGVGPEQLRIEPLLRRVREDGVTEVVMATNPTLEGDGTALYLSNLLENLNVQITRLARGIASGSVLEFANREMLADAMRGRQQF
ncbi:MAG: recombination mediator RecR [Planctomycetota bacterium]|nr:recombination mediator RecR [Planctomycetota bacterium]MEC9008373.1 recombination mediator RecR [Planctomycetota bacterium]MED5399766.1 recombination mediator RecR [Planctomycetota bacterium]MEE3365491.1 recombination mediator RecR [Planctomycetota bacterium]